MSGRQPKIPTVDEAIEHLIAVTQGERLAQTTDTATALAVLIAEAMAHRSVKQVVARMREIKALGGSDERIINLLTDLGTAINGSFPEEL